MESKYFRIVSKYALLLAVTFGIEVLVGIYWDDVAPIFHSQGDLWYMTMLSRFLGIFLNVICVVVALGDIRRMQLKTRWVIIATLLSRPLGISLLLLFMLLKDQKSLTELPEDSTVIDR
jgi:hypothetical protein